MTSPFMELGKARRLLCVSTIVIAFGCSGESSKNAPYAPPSVSPGADRTTSAADSARQFAQAFYEWYVPLSNRSAGQYDSLLADRRDFLTPGLYAALRADVEGQRADTVTEIVSVIASYDPFLNSQDPCDKYEVRDAKPITGGFAVGIYAACPSAPPSGLAIVAEVARGTHGWQFVNFRDPSMPDYDLLGQFQKVKRERETPAPMDTARH